MSESAPRWLLPGQPRVETFWLFKDRANNGPNACGKATVAEISSNSTELGA